MKFVKAEWDPQLPGFHVDPRDYQAELPGLRDELPCGAWEFVSDEDHYRFGGPRCVKDLELSEISVPTEKGGALTLGFSPNEWKHDAGLRIRYQGVSRFAIDSEQAIDWMRVDTVLLDEVLPIEGGCVHEIALTDSTIVVHCTDLVATWHTDMGPVG